jgi:uncharacterized protein DUF2510/HIRAN domain-containing protein
MRFGKKRLQQHATSQPSPGWLHDPQVPGQLRYWDGGRWTEHTAPVTAAPALPAAQTVPVSSAIRWPASGTDRGAATPSVEELVARLRHEAPRHPLEEQVEVVGETYNAKGIKKVFADAGRPITAGGSTLDDETCILVPEPWNPYDPNAVAVAVGRHQVGHLPKELAIDYARGLGALAARGLLATGEARLWALNEKGIIRARVTILIPEAESFE